MSGWDLWADQILANPNHKTADAGGIYGLDGNPWVEKNFDKIGLRGIPPSAIADLLQAMKDGVQAISKVEINNKKYMILKTEDDMLIAKSGPGGLTVSKAKTCCVVGIYDGQDVQPGNNTAQVGKVCENLKANQF